MDMRLQGAISGITVLGLPPVKLIQFADNMNLFLSLKDDMDKLQAKLSLSSLAIGSKFNYEKTDVLRVGLLAHCSVLMDDPMLGTVLDCFTGAFILPPGSLLWVLGVWIGSPDIASA